MRENHLLDLANGVVRKAMARGASDAECTIAEGDEFSAEVRMREIESLKEAGSRGVGLRILMGKRTGSSYTSDLSGEGIERLVADALAQGKLPGCVVAIASAIATAGNTWPPVPPPTIAPIPTIANAGMLN